MRLPAFLAILLLSLNALSAVVTETGSLRGFLYGSEPSCAYDNWVTHVSEGQVSYLNVYAPWEVQNNDFGDFLVPDSLDLQNWGDIMSDFLIPDPEAAQRRIDRLGYPFQVVRFQDLDSGRNLYMIRELLNDDIDTNDTADTADDEIGSFDYGWGLFIYDPSASRPIVVTCVHPCDDYPAPVFALESFLELDARFLLINGAGREVAYTPPYNTNNASLSDPSRNPDHPFNVAYQRCADQIRGLTGKLEFSLQIHSYDWNKYPGEPNVMLSAGKGRGFPALPIRDASRSQSDIINHTPFLVHPQNSIGTHSEVNIDDFYSVNYDDSDPVWYQNEGQNIQLVKNDVLPGAEFNQQMLYTAPQNLYDVYSPFLHVEMDELPKCYVRSEAMWYWFFGFDTQTQTWNAAQRYTRSLQFYKPWLDALNEVIDSMLVLDDGTGPSNPENLRLTSLNGETVTFTWDRSYCYDFDSYEFELRYEQDGYNIISVFDRNTNPELAWQNTSAFTLPLEGGYRVYYLRIRARDKHGNYSPFTPELKIWKLGNPFTEFSASAGDNSVALSFSCPLTSPVGYNVYRCQGNGAYSKIGNWHDDAQLLTNASGNYAFTDTAADNGIIYSYQVSLEFPDGNEIFHWQILRASPFRRYSLVLKNSQYALLDTLFIGTNPLSGDGEDAFDLLHAAATTPLMLVSHLVNSTDSYSRDIRYIFDADTGYKCWNIQYRSSYTGVYLSFDADPRLIMEGAELLLYDVERDYWYDLRQGSYIWQSSSNAWRNLRLYWGYRAPIVQFTPASDVFLRLGESLDLNWQVINYPRVAALDLWLCAERDSINIASGLSPHATQQSYTPSAIFSGARFLVLLHCLDGSLIRQYSTQRFSTIPQEMSYELLPGSTLVSFPVSGLAQDLFATLQPFADLYSLDNNDTWQQAQELAPRSGYLLHCEHDFQFSLPAQIPSAQVIQSLDPGWNLLPNPLYHQFELRDLYFYHNGIRKSYAQMVAESLLPPHILLCDHSGFTTAHSLPPCKSALLMYFGSEPLAVIFDPWYYEGETIGCQNQWSVTLSVADGLRGADAIQLGTADLSTAALDPLFDLLKVPEPPSAPYRLALLRFDAQSGEMLELQSEYKGLYPDYNFTEKVWNFHLQVNTLRPLRFVLDSAQLPENYSLELIFAGQSTFLQHGSTYWFTPPHAGVFNGAIRIRSYLPDKGTPLFPAEITAYPNPFRESVSIHCPVTRGEPVSVTIFNLRGQLLRKLLGEKGRDADTGLLWDGRDESGKQVSPGVYLLKAESAGTTLTGKLIRY